MGNFLNSSSVKRIEYIVLEVQHSPTLSQSFNRKHTQLTLLWPMPKAKNFRRSLRNEPYNTSETGTASPANERRESGQAVAKGGTIGLNLVTPNTSLGQHFLKNPAVVSAIVAKAAIRSTDVVLEIGPGTGNMTVPLLAKAKSVVAVEYDPRMIREVLKRVEGTPEKEKLRIIRGDAVKTAWPFFDVCVANIPYKISSPLIFKLLAHRPTFRCAVIMLQEEFALRLTARPGEDLYCRLSVNVQLLARVDQLMKVGRNNFRPPPKVESRVVRIEPRNPPPPINFIEWDGMVRLLFNRKNKTLRSVLMTKPTIKMLAENMRTHESLKLLQKQGEVDKQSDTMMDTCEKKSIQSSQQNVKDIIEEVTGLEEWVGKRSSKLDLDDFLSLLAEFNKRGIHFA